jgi:hypothetical protein
MTIEELKVRVRGLLAAAFPWVTIQFEKISDDPFHVGVGVFGVERQLVKWVEERILDIDAKICADTEFALTPLVRDEATTQKYYPDLMSAWKAVGVFHGHKFAGSSIEVRENCIGVGFSSRFPSWEYESTHPTSADSELALAA